MGNLAKIQIAEIRENPVALRAVNNEDERYLGLVESIKAQGFLGTITVRPSKDGETGQDYYELVDGLHRFCAAKDAGLTEINVDIVELNDDQVLEAQIMTNIHKVETKPIDYSKQLLRILSRNPLMTEAELAMKLGKSTQWIKERLGLTKIASEEIQSLVNEGKITLANAYALAKLPAEEMADFVDRAITLSPDEFVPACQARAKEIRDAKRKGENADVAEFAPVAFLQKMKDVKEELETGAVASVLLSDCQTPMDGYKRAIEWMLHLDPKSVEAQKAKDDARKAERDAAKKKRDIAKAEKTAQKAKEAAAAAESAKAELEKNA